MEPTTGVIIVFFLLAAAVVTAAGSPSARKNPSAITSTVPPQLVKQREFGTRARLFTLMTNPTTFCDRVVEFFQTHDIQQRRAMNAPLPAQTSWWFVSRRSDAERAVYATIMFPEGFPMRDVRTMFRVDLMVQYDFFGRTLRFEWVVTSGGLIEPRSPLSKEIIQYTIERILDIFQVKIDAEVARSQAVQPVAMRAELIKFWPSPQDYNEAIQNPSSCFKVDTLRSSRVEENEIGLPRVATGAFASVYKLATSDGDCAVKCFLGLTPDLELRYGMLSGFILNDDLECTVDFDFVSEGIRVRDTWYPVLRMVWVDGAPLTSYVEDCLDDRSKLEALCKNFRATCDELHRVGIAHGDLQHGNILVTANGIRLVDYDGMFVPGMNGMESNEIGHRNYQHPKRKSTNFGPYLDNFSEWVIQLSLHALIAEPKLWTELTGGDECLLLRKTDFDAPDQSLALNRFDESPSEDVRALCSRFRELLHANVEACDRPHV